MAEDPTARFVIAERALFERYAVPFGSRRVRLADPAVAVRVLETGSGAPVLVIHGSGMSASTWAPVLAHLTDRRALCVDLPGFGLSDPYDYSGRSLRAHAVAQVTSMLDALELDRAVIAGTSLGAMWALCAALDAPDRVEGVVAIGMPAAALPGLRGDPFFTLMTVPGLGRLVARGPKPRSAKAARKGMAKVIGPRALERTPDEFFEVVAAGMAKPGWGSAMWTHLNLAMRFGRPRPGNALEAGELAAITAPVRFMWGDGDVYGGPEIGRRAVEQLPDARLDVIGGGHAPFLDEPERCAELILRGGR